MPQRALHELEDRHYGRRVAAFVAAGAVIAMVLTWFMHQLIHSSQQRLDESGHAHLVDFVRLKREETSTRKDRRPARPTQAQAPPAPAAPEADSSRSETTLSVSAPVIPDGLDSAVQIGGLGFDSSDGEYLPIVKIAPVYPHRGQYRGIEGECVVIFTVTTTGSTRDVRVVERECTDRMFHKPSIEAAKKFKYKPRVIDGQAVEVHGVKNRFIYELPDPE